MTKKIVMYCDGGCSGNGRGDADVYGSFVAYEVPVEETYVIKKGDTCWDKHLELAKTDPIELCSRFDIFTARSERPTNNLAEAKTLLAALSWLHKRCGRDKEVTNCEICMDSQLVLFQVQGVFSIRNPSLKRIHGESLQLLNRIRNSGVEVKFCWIPGDLMKKTVIAH